MNNSIKEYFILDNGNRQKLKLSRHAIDIIKADRLRFYSGIKPKTIKGFINVIISNYYSIFPLSTEVALKENESVRNNLISSGIDKDAVNKAVEEINTMHMDKLIKEYQDKFEIGTGYFYTVLLNKKNIELLEKLSIAKYFFNKSFSPLSLYLEILLESYASLKKNQRAEVIFKKTIDIIKSAIHHDAYIEYKDGIVNTKTFPISLYHLEDSPIPYLSIEDDNFDTVECLDDKYLSIKDLERNKVHELKEKNIYYSEMHDFLNDRDEFKTDVNRSKESLKRKFNFLVRFTKVGLERFLYEEDDLSILGIPDKIDKYLYTFKTNETEVFYNLFKFGSSMEIIKPIEVRNRFKKLYKASYDKYNNKKEN